MRETAFIEGVQRVGETCCVVWSFTYTALLLSSARPTATYKPATQPDPTQLPRYACVPALPPTPPLLPLPAQPHHEPRRSTCALTPFFTLDRLPGDHP